MSLQRYLQKLRHIDALIKRRATGNQKQLAVKMRLSRSGLNKLLNEMREAGFPIKYDYINQTYYYELNGGMVQDLFKKEFSSLV